MLAYADPVNWIKVLDFNLQSYWRRKNKRAPKFSFVGKKKENVFVGKKTLLYFCYDEKKKKVSFFGLIILNEFRRK